MKQVITSQGIMIQGNAAEVLNQLKALSFEYKTLKDLLDFHIHGTSLSRE